MIVFMMTLTVGHHRTITLSNEGSQMFDRTRQRPEGCNRADTKPMGTEPKPKAKKKKSKPVEVTPDENETEQGQ